MVADRGLVAMELTRGSELSRTPARPAHRPALRVRCSGREADARLVQTTASAGDHPAHRSLLRRPVANASRQRVLPPLDPLEM